MGKKAEKVEKVRETSEEPMNFQLPRKDKNTRKKIWKIAIWIFATAVIATPNLLYSQSGISFSPVLSGSMRPVTNTGDVLLNREVKASTLKVGEIITVYNQVAGTFYSHRIVEIKIVNSALQFSTKGDSNSAIDNVALVVPPTNAVSKEYFVLPPWAGHAMVFLWSSRGHDISSIFLVTSYILVVFLFLFRKKIKANFGAEKIYKELYSEERSTSEHYKNVLNHLKEIETERSLIQNSR